MTTRKFQTDTQFYVHLVNLSLKRVCADRCVSQAVPAELLPSTVQQLIFTAKVTCDFTWNERPDPQIQINPEQINISRFIL